VVLSTRHGNTYRCTYTYACPRTTDLRGSGLELRCRQASSEGTETKSQKTNSKRTKSQNGLNSRDKSKTEKSIDTVANRTKC